MYQNKVLYLHTDTAHTHNSPYHCRHPGKNNIKLVLVLLLITMIIFLTIIIIIIIITIIIIIIVIIIIILLSGAYECA